MRLSIREAALLGLLLVLGGVFLTDHYILQPLVRHKQQLISEKNNLTMELLGLQNKLIEYQSTEKDDSKRQDDYQEMLAAVPPTPMIPDIIDYLEASARKSMVKLISIRYKESAAGNPALQPSQPGSELAQVIPINFQIVAHGSHYDLLSFLLEIENAPRIYVINSSKISLAMQEQSAQVITTPVHNPDMAVSEKAVEKATTELASYDQSKLVLNLDFNAYYHSSSSNVTQP